MQGRKPVEVQELHAGDLGAVAKLRVTLTGDTLGDKAHEIFLEPVAMPEPAMTYAIEPKSRADEDKLAPALHKLMEDDRWCGSSAIRRRTSFWSPGRGSRTLRRSCRS